MALMADMLDCDLEIRELEPHSFYYVQFWTDTFGKGMNNLILLAIGDTF